MPRRDAEQRLVILGAAGLGRGGPTVILEAAAGAHSAREPGPVPRTSQTVVDELRALLSSAGIRGPYVLVGHSLGGFHHQLFARQDGGRQVAGVLPVDATPCARA